jgi:hypothetical protein
MAETADPLAALIANWKQTTDAYLSAFNKTLGDVKATPEAQAATSEAAKTYLGTRAAMADVTHQAYEPLIEMAGGVTMSEFRRLMDLVYGIHLRLDRVDDALRDLKASTAAKPRRKAKKADQA